MSIEQLKQQISNNEAKINAAFDNIKKYHEFSRIFKNSGIEMEFYGKTKSMPKIKIPTYDIKVKVKVGDWLTLAEEDRVNTSLVASGVETVYEIIEFDTMGVLVRIVLDKGYSLPFYMHNKKLVNATVRNKNTWGTNE